MSFDWPLAFVAIAAFPLVVALYLRRQRRATRYSVKFSNFEVLEGVVGSVSLWRRRVPALLYGLAAASLLMGLARPETTVLVPREEATVILAIDTSGSMKAADVDPTRLAAAQRSAASFVDRLPAKFKVALVTFADNAQVLAQPSTDRPSVQSALDSLNADGATAMGDAIVDALELVRRSESDRTLVPGRPTPGPSPAPDPGPERPSAVLLLSDGFNTAGSIEPMEAADQAAELSIPVFTIALGTPDGVVELEDQFGNPRLVRVPPDYETLKSIADTTGAEYFEAPTESDLDRVYSELGSRIGFVEEDEEITYAFAAAAAALAIAAGALALIWNGRLP
ncbi:MAG TPA: VWA domain-containing protein [Actinomycetota bacterium]|nr:VWA domain-containing protein [Actinomycetota bacterium]